MIKMNALETIFLTVFTSQTTPYLSILLAMYNKYVQMYYENDFQFSFLFAAYA